MRHFLNKDKATKIETLMENISAFEQGEYNSEIVFTKKTQDLTYAIIRENNRYIIKTSLNKDSILIENFDYYGGLKNKEKFSKKTFNESKKQLFGLLAEKQSLLNESYIEEDDDKYVIKKEVEPSEFDIDDVPDVPMDDDDGFGGEEDIDAPPVDDTLEGDGDESYQVMTGELSQLLRSPDDFEDYNAVVKYVLKSLFAAVDIERLEEGDKQEIISSFNADFMGEEEEEDEGTSFDEMEGQENGEEELEEVYSRTEEPYQGEMHRHVNTDSVVDNSLQESFQENTNTKDDSLKSLKKELSSMYTTKIVKKNGQYAIKVSDKHEIGEETFEDEYYVTQTKRGFLISTHDKKIPKKNSDDVVSFFIKMNKYHGGFDDSITETLSRTEEPYQGEMHRNVNTDSVVDPSLKENLKEGQQIVEVMSSNAFLIKFGQENTKPFTEPVKDEDLKKDFVNETESFFEDWEEDEYYDHNRQDLDYIDQELAGGHLSRGDVVPSIGNYNPSHPIEDEIPDDEDDYDTLLDDSFLESDYSFSEKNKKFRKNPFLRQ